MKAVVFDGSAARVQVREIPALGVRQALIRVTRAGICNTDLEIFQGYMGFRGIPGHEFVGIVEAGPAEWVGKRVVGEINVADGTCDMCRAGVPSQCRGRTTVGIDRHDGAFAEYLALTVDNLHEVPDTVTDDEAVFVEPLAAGVNALECVTVGPGDKVILIGAGKLGLLTAQVFKNAGCNLTVITRRAGPQQLLDQWGIAHASLDDLPRNMADIIVDCTGNADGFAAAIALVRPRGTVILKSTYTEMPKADLTRVVIDEIRVVGSRCGPFDKALNLLDSRAVEVEPMISARYPLAQAEDAFRHAAQPGMLKMLLDL